MDKTLESHTTNDYIDDVFLGKAKTETQKDFPLQPVITPPDNTPDGTVTDEQTSEPPTGTPTEQPQPDFTLTDNPKSDPSVGIFTVKPANQVIDEAKSRPKPCMLFGQLWFEGEICILFADTNLGKSILAVQIADGISKGRDIMGLQMTAKPQAVVYCDFELSDKQFEIRYSSEDGDHHDFSPNLMRVCVNPYADFDDGYDFEEEVKQSLERLVSQYDAKVIIIDNLTWLSRETEKAKDALPLMKWLKAFGSKYGLSILVLAHTPKRNLSNPITQNDLQGSKMLINFCDGCFAIGKSTQGTSIRYLKEIKQRNELIKYTENNVYVCEIRKIGNFLQFCFVSYGQESEHLRQFGDGERERLVSQVKELTQQGKTQRDIADTLGISVGTVNNYLNKQSLK